MAWRVRLLRVGGQRKPEQDHHGKGTLPNLILTKITKRTIAEGMLRSLKMIPEEGTGASSDHRHRSWLHDEITREDRMWSALGAAAQKSHLALFIVQLSLPLGWVVLFFEHSPSLLDPLLHLNWPVCRRCGGFLILRPHIQTRTDDDRADRHSAATVRDGDVIKMISM